MQMHFNIYPHKVKSLQSNNHIFCVIRKKWLLLTPEEWVRQNVLQYLIENNYPTSVLAVEKKILLQQEIQKRFDIVVYQQAKPWMLIECKEMNVPINEKVLQQIIAYNSNLQCRYLLLTNGNSSIMWQLQPTVTQLHFLPEYQ